MNEEWNEQLFTQDLEFSESPDTPSPSISWATIILLATICLCIFGGCQ